MDQVRTAFVYEMDGVCIDICTVHDTKNLTFSAAYRVGDPQIATQPSVYVCTDD